PAIFTPFKKSGATRFAEKSVLGLFRVLAGAEGKSPTMLNPSRGGGGKLWTSDPLGPKAARLPKGNLPMKLHLHLAALAAVLCVAVYGSESSVRADETRTNATVK